MKLSSLIFSLALLLPTFAWGHSIVPVIPVEPVVNVVLQEAANEPFKGMIAVAGVVFDRVTDRRWPSTVHKVIYQPRQFAGIHIKMRKYSRKQIGKARLAVAIALAGIRPYGRVLWFHSGVKPSWTKKLVVNGKLGGHIFYGDRKMDLNEIYLAKVSRSPSSQTVYVRLTIPQSDGIPLAIKATFRGFSPYGLPVGTMVEVKRIDPMDARRYRVISIRSKENIVHRINVQDVDAFRRHQAMVMSKDRVRFFLGVKYFHERNFKKVLRQAFDIAHGEAGELMQDDGFWIICRPSQFARFMIYRNAAGIQNGFMDLRAELVASKEPDAYAELADITGVSREDVKKVAHAIGYSGALLSKKLRPVRRAPAEIDVGGRAHQICYSI